MKEVGPGLYVRGKKACGYTLDGGDDAPDEIEKNDAEEKADKGEQCE